jgi:hypothetical protein
MVILTDLRTSDLAGVLPHKRCLIHYEPVVFSTRAFVYSRGLQTSRHAGYIGINGSRGQITQILHTGCLKLAIKHAVTYMYIYIYEVNK